MAYSSSLSDAEWEILEPLLPEVLPPKHKTRPLPWSYRDLIDGILYHLKNGCVVTGNVGDLVGIGVPLINPFKDVSGRSPA
jgi:hypothetical protein